MDVRAAYRGYLACCNERRWDDLADFVHDPVSVNGRPLARSSYVERLRSVVTAFPDHRWQVIHDVATADRIAVVLGVTGTNAGVWHGARRPGTSVRTHEVAVYLFADGRIRETWAGRDDLAVLAQLGAAR